MRDLLALQVVLGPYAPAARRANQSLIAVHLRFQKYSASRFGQIKIISAAVSSHREGRLAIVTNAGRDAMDADGPLTNGT